MDGFPGKTIQTIGQEWGWIHNERRGKGRYEREDGSAAAAKAKAPSIVSWRLVTGFAGIFQNVENSN